MKKILNIFATIGLVTSPLISVTSCGPKKLVNESTVTLNHEFKLKKGVKDADVIKELIKPSSKTLNNFNDFVKGEQLNSVKYDESKHQITTEHAYWLPFYWNDVSNNFINYLETFNTGINTIKGLEEKYTNELRLNNFIDVSSFIFTKNIKSWGTEKTEYGGIQIEIQTSAFDQISSEDRKKITHDYNKLITIKDSITLIAIATNKHYWGDSPILIGEPVELGRIVLKL